MNHTPVSTNEVFAGLSKQSVFDLEKDYGNTDLIRTIGYAGISGPFKVASPWELEDPEGVKRINAGGYAASPFGDRYPPLMQFLRRYLKEGQAMGLPQQAVSEWRAALETNLVRLVAEIAPSHADSKVFFSNSGSEAIEAASRDIEAIFVKILLDTMQKSVPQSGLFEKSSGMETWRRRPRSAMAFSAVWRTSWRRRTSV